MRHGCLNFRWGGSQRQWRRHGGRIASIAALLLLSAAQLSRADSPLRFTLIDTDHPSGLYSAKDDAKLTCLVENLADRPMPLAGTIVFGPLPTGDARKFAPVSSVPIAATTVPAGKTVKLDIPVTFAGVGPYEIHFRADGSPDVVIPHPNALQLAAIFAPRGADTPAENPWLTTLPRAAAQVPGFLADYTARTSIRRFLLEESFLFDPETRRTPVAGASLEASAEQLAALFTDLAKSRGQIILRVSVPVLDTPDARSIAAFHQYIADAVTRSKKTVAAIAVTPDLPASANISDDQISSYRAYYMAAYEAAKKTDKSVLLLGTSESLLTHKLLLTPGKNHADLRAYVDVLGVTDTAQQLALARKLVEGTKTPLWVLPPRNAQFQIVPAAALAEGATVTAVAPMGDDRGVTAHLLGGAVFFQRVHPELLPYIVAFQGDGYSVAAITGLGSGTPLDAACPALRAPHTEVVLTAKPEAPVKAAEGPYLEVSDDATSMRTVDAAGAPVDCRVGDTLYIPATDRVVYLLQGGNAEDLVALLRTSVGKHLPMFDVAAAALGTVGPDSEKHPTLALRLRNVSPGELSGTLRVLVTIARQPVEIATNELAAAKSGKDLELVLPLSQEIPPNSPITLEFIAPAQTQRTSLQLKK